MVFLTKSDQSVQLCVHPGAHFAKAAHWSCDLLHFLSFSLIYFVRFLKHSLIHTHKPLFLMSVLTGYFCETGHRLWYDDMNCNSFIEAGAFSINHCLRLCPFYSSCFLLFVLCVRQTHCRDIKVREQEELVKVWKSTVGTYCICCAQRRSSRVRIEFIFAFLKSKTHVYFFSPLADIDI